MRKICTFNVDEIDYWSQSYQTSMVKAEISVYIVIVKKQQQL